MYWQHYEIVLEQRADALRQAEHNRLIRMVTACQTKSRGAVLPKTLGALGRFLDTVKASLQAQAPSPSVAPRRA